MKRILALCGLLTATAMLGTSCVMTRVPPWDRDLLAEPEMLPVPEAVELGIDEHVYFSKETAHGGAGVGGGGCGCN